jgi:hypothetical protein
MSIYEKELPRRLRKAREWIAMQEQAAALQEQAFVLAKQIINGEIGGEAARVKLRHLRDELSKYEKEVANSFTTSAARKPG